MPEAWAPTAVGAVDGTTCVTLKIQGARTCTRADGYGCIRCSLYRALDLTAYTPAHATHRMFHVRVYRSIFVQCTTLGLVRYTRFTHQLSKFYNFSLAQRRHSWLLGTRQIVTWLTNTVIKVTHLNAFTIIKVPRGSLLLPW